MVVKEDQEEYNLVRQICIVSSSGTLVNKEHTSKEHIVSLLCSFDVFSLFANVPLDETIQICLTKLYSVPDPPSLPRTVLKDLLEFATKKSHFRFDGQYYDQIDGVAMGSPLGPVLANIFMCHFAESWLTNNQFRPSIWFRYVHDTFSLFDSKDTASRFLDFLNSRHPKISQHQIHHGT